MANPILRLYIDGEQKVKVKPDVVQTIYSDFQYNFIASGSTVVEQNGKDVIIYSAVPDTALEFVASGSTQINRNDNVITIFSPSVDTSTFLSIEDFNQYVLDLNINQYITDSEMSTILQTLNTEIATKTSVLDVENIVNIYLANYYTKSEIDLIIANLPSGGGGISSWTELQDIPVWLNYATLNGFENGHTHSYNDLRDKPTIPTLLSQLTNDSNYITLNDIPTIPSDISELSDNTNLLFDKDYNSLINKPIIPSVPTNLSAFTNDSGYINDLSLHSATELSDISSVGSGAIITSTERTKLNNALVNADKGDTVATLDVNKKLVQEVDASKITSGTIDIQRLPAGALERLVEVENEIERFSLTINDVQNGDTVKQLDTDVMYRVVDDLNLNNALGYKEYVAGRAAAVDWSGVENKPSFHAVATSGNYNDLLNKPSIPSDVNELNDSSNLLFDKNYNSLTNKPSIPTIASYNVWNGTQAQYDALGTYSSTTIYLIDEE